jgi:thiol-disulfide isomerase/thioredoxin
MKQKQTYLLGTGAHFFSGGIISSLSNVKMSPVLFFIFFPLLSVAQQSVSPKVNDQQASFNTHPSTLTIGDSFPQSLLTTHHSPLTILDFFATWCGACIKTFPRLDSLQQTFDSALNLVLVNSRYSGDDSAKVNAFFKKFRGPSGKPYPFNLVYNDTVLNNFFPHKLVPHYVWIKSGKVIAITGFEELTEANIRKAITGQTLNLRLKKEVMDYKPALPLLDAGNGGDMANLLFRFSLTGELDGFNPGTRKWSDATIQKITFLNQTPQWLLAYATRMPATRILWEATGAQAIASKDHRFCLELTLPLRCTESERRNYLLQALTTSFAWELERAQKPLPCYVLRKTKQKPPLAKKAAGPYSYTSTNAPLSKLVALLNSGQTAVVNEAGDDWYTLQLTAPLTDLNAMATELQQYGLSLIPATRAFEVILVKEKKH